MLNEESLSEWDSSSSNSSEDESNEQEECNVPINDNYVPIDNNTPFVLNLVFRE